MGLALAMSLAPGDITPADGSRHTGGSVTVSAQSPFTGGTLIVDGVRRGTGWGLLLKHTLDGHAVPNGTHTASLDLTLTGRGEKTTFVMAVPAYAPREVAAAQNGSAVTVRWAANPEPDITGYTISSRFSSRTVGKCGPCSTSFQLPGDAGGELAVQVVANRAGADASPASTSTISLTVRQPAPQPAPQPAATPSHAPVIRPEPSARATRPGSSTAARPGTTSPAAVSPSSAAARPAATSSPAASGPAVLPSVAAPEPALPDAPVAVRSVAGTDELNPGYIWVIPAALLGVLGYVAFRFRRRPLPIMAAPKGAHRKENGRWTPPEGGA